MEPAVLDDGGSGRFVLVVPLHDVFAPDDEFADPVARQFPPLIVDDFGVDAGEGGADGAGLGDFFEAIEGTGGRRLGEAVAFQNAHPELLLENGNEVGGHRGAAGYAEFERTDVEFRRLFVEDHADVQAGHGADVGDLFPFNRCEKRVHGQAVHHDRGAAGLNHVEHVDGCAERMKQGD